MKFVELYECCISLCSLKLPEDEHNLWSGRNIEAKSQHTVCKELDAKACVYRYSLFLQLLPATCRPNTSFKTKQLFIFTTRLMYLDCSLMQYLPSERQKQLSEEWILRNDLFPVIQWLLKSFIWIGASLNTTSSRSSLGRLLKIWSTIMPPRFPPFP